MNYFLLYIQLIYLNTFLASQTLKITPLITYGHYRKITVYSYSYDLTLALLISYVINNVSNISFKNISVKKLFIYQGVTLLSAIIFALLGEVKFLQNFTISGDFWKHLSLREIIVFLIIGIPLVYLTCRDFFIIWRDKKCKNTIFAISAMLNLFIINYVLLIVNSAKNVHYHIHHAIFSTFMALQFNDLSNNLMIIGNAIYMGVLIEGISFYGIQELYIFMTDSTTPITNMNYSLIVTVLGIIGWIFITCLNFKRITKYHIYIRGKPTMLAPIPKPAPERALTAMEGT
jgi:hypothetical protein